MPMKLSSMNEHTIIGIICQVYILLAVTAAGVVSCGGPIMYPRTSSIVQIISLLRSFEISKDI